MTLNASKAKPSVEPATSTSNSRPEFGITYVAPCWFSMVKQGTEELRPAHGSHAWAELEDGSIILCTVQHWRLGLQHMTSFYDASRGYDLDVAKHVVRWTPVMKPLHSKESPFYKKT